jgi:hypothetical protein
MTIVVEADAKIVTFLTTAVGLEGTRGESARIGHATLSARGSLRDTTKHS